MTLVQNQCANNGLNWYETCTISETCLKRICEHNEESKRQDVHKMQCIGVLDIIDSNKYISRGFFMK